jgi:excisionase family DNA binding protein
MRKLLVIGGEGNMAGMSADTSPDDMLGLIKALKDNPAHDFILFHFTDRFFMPPEDPEAIIPLFADMDIVPKILLQIVGEDAFRKLIRKNPTDDDLLNEARKHRAVFHKKLLEKATFEALRLFYHAFLSFTGGRHIVLVCRPGSEYSQALLKFFWPANEDGMAGKRVYKKSFALINPIREWPMIFKRFKAEMINPGELLPGHGCILEFPGCTRFKVEEALVFCGNALDCECKIHYLATDDLNNPRALRMESPSGGWLLAIPRPSNMGNFAKGLRAGGGTTTTQTPEPAAEPVTQAVEVVRNWMTREEAAEMIKLSKDTVDNLRSEGVLVDAPKAGRQVRITKASVQRYLDRTG